MTIRPEGGGGAWSIFPSLEGLVGAPGVIGLCQ